jgi:hypothetical protein
MVLELLRLGTMLLIPHHFHLLWQKLLQHWSMPLLCWPRIRTEIRVELIQCMEYQKPVFAAQQLRGAAGAWWANLVAR